MPNFLETILAQLKRANGRVVFREIRGDRFVSVTGRELLDQVQLVRLFLRNSGVQPGDRCTLLAPNSIRWAVFHLALMAEGIIVVPGGWNWAREGANVPRPKRRTLNPKATLLTS